MFHFLTRTLCLLAIVMTTVLVLAERAHAQEELEWAVSAGGTDLESGLGVAVDGNGNSIICGQFLDSATFGAGPSAVTLTSAGDFDIFVAKYAADGTLLWAVSAGGTRVDLGIGVAVDGNGNSFVTGRFEDNATFGSGPSAVTLTSVGHWDIFVAKYAADGALLWAKSVGSISLDVGTSVAVDGNGNGIISGYFHSSATFGAGLNAVTLTSVGRSDIFVAKYATDGTLLWAVSAGGTDYNGGLGYDGGRGVTVDGNGNSIVSGYFQGSATFGAGPSEVTLTSTGDTDIFMAKYSPDSTLLWAVSAGGADLDHGRGVAVDGNGNSFVTGHFQGSATFGVGPSEVTLTSAGDWDIFVAKYAADGTLLWAANAGSTGADAGIGVAVDGHGNSIVSGYFEDSATFGAAPNAVTLTSAGGADVFAAKYAAHAVLLWAVSAGGTDYDGSYGMAVDGNDNSIVSGYFQGSATFGVGSTAVTLTSVDRNDIFVAKYAATNYDYPTYLPLMVSP